MYKYVVGLILVSVLSGCSEDPSTYPSNDISYQELNDEIGCESKYSDDKKEDIFKSEYKNNWMIWEGDIVLVEADSISLNVDGVGIQDLHVSLADSKAGYNLEKDDYINIKFVMKRAGGCFLPFVGNNAIVR